MFVARWGLAAYPPGEPRGALGRKGGFPDTEVVPTLKAALNVHAFARSTGTCADIEFAASTE